MMECPKCKFEIKDGWKFCPCCSLTIDKKRLCQTCENELKPNWKACPICGKKTDLTSDDILHEDPERLKEVMDRVFDQSEEENEQSDTENNSESKIENETHDDWDEFEGRLERGEVSLPDVRKYPTKWLNFYTNIRLPLSIFIGFGTLTQAHDAYTKNPAYGINYFLMIAQLILMIFLMVGLHKRRLWGWRLNWFILGMETFLLPLNQILETPVNDVLFEKMPSSFFIIYAGLVVVCFLIWFLPNYIYFKKRRALFY